MLVLFREANSADWFRVSYLFLCVTKYEVFFFFFFFWGSFSSPRLDSFFIPTAVRSKVLFFFFLCLDRSLFLCRSSVLVSQTSQFSPVYSYKCVRTSHCMDSRKRKKYVEKECRLKKVETQMQAPAEALHTTIIKGYILSQSFLANTCTDTHFRPPRSGRYDQRLPANPSFIV